MSIMTDAWLLPRTQREGQAAANIRRMSRSTNPHPPSCRRQRDRAPIPNSARRPAGLDRSCEANRVGSRLHRGHCQTYAAAQRADREPGRRSPRHSGKLIANALSAGLHLIACLTYQAPSQSLFPNYAQLLHRASNDRATAIDRPRHSTQNGSTARKLNHPRCRGNLRCARSKSKSH